MDRNRTPLWNDALAYPAQGPAILTILVLALLRLLAYVPAWGWLLDLGVWLATYRYAADVLWQSAHGRDDAPEGYNADASTGWTMLVAQFALILFILATSLVFGGFAGIVALALACFAMPGVCMSVAMDGDLVHAINPATWLKAASRLGGAYVGLVLACVVFAAAQIYAPVVVLKLLPGPIAIVVYHFIAQYLVVAAFRAMGLTIFRHRDVLDFAPNEAIVRVERRPDPDAVLIAEADRRAKAGDVAGAAAHLAATMDARAVSPGVHARYRELLLAANDRAALAAHTHRLVDIALAQERPADALAALRDARLVDIAFLPRHGDALAAIAREARRTSDYKLALELVEALRAREPKHAEGLELAIMGAQLLALEGRDADGRAMLERARSDYARNPRVGELDAALTASAPRVQR